MDSDVPDSRRVIDYGTKYWFVSLVPNEDGLYWLPKSRGALMRLQNNKDTQACDLKTQICHIVSTRLKEMAWKTSVLWILQYSAPLCIDHLFNGVFRCWLSSCDLIKETFVKQHTWLWTEDSFGSRIFCKNGNVFFNLDPIFQCFCV